VRSGATFVPVEAWHYNSPEVKHGGHWTDVGLLAEALLYYDKVYLGFKNEEELAEIIDRFKASGAADDLVDLIRDRVLVPYYYACNASRPEARAVERLESSGRRGGAGGRL